MNLNEEEQIELWKSGALPGRVWFLGFMRTVGRWGGIWVAENLSGRERWEQRLGCMSEFGAQNEMPKVSSGREKGVEVGRQTDSVCGMEI